MIVDESHEALLQYVLAMYPQQRGDVYFIEFIEEVDGVMTKVGEVNFRRLMQLFPEMRLPFLHQVRSSMDWFVFP